MQQYQVPQFIDVEDKIIGPLTLKQFLYLVGGGAIIIIARALFVPILFYAITLVVGAISVGLAFFKVNGVPLPTIISSAFFYFSKPHLYIWKQEEVHTKPGGGTEAFDVPKIAPKTSEAKLEDLAWSLDIKEKTDRK
jgi:hypothetical protein